LKATAQFLKCNNKEFRTTPRRRNSRTPKIQEKHGDQIFVSVELQSCEIVRFSLKKLFFQVKDAAVSLRLVKFGSQIQLFYTQITEKTGGGRGVRRGVLAFFLILNA
jgi:hypothetical protein